ncbi:TetR family transcriptional regulator [Mycolicibacterium madagascariense]|uniref:TetR family transcriptional regulator n=1 Tax=Mycolicibacterium madagascariense TaxID=212765 RepID=A0A7I7X9U0_9MYCO|nr:TetR family transcriptional regulator [Mycolicibacterium madagascariense]MCV7011804.1 TetR/AcrR family transcriptional regulator [Mycolicibacterium madagascariense]BBZ26344.1 TetR family transcriptional regulator [Mycolicibacterium madagascariense]
MRPYGGVQARDRVADRRRRLLEAGLQLLGSSDRPDELTVRAVCAEAAVSARYFYESFTDKDQLVAAVFDGVIADIAATTQAAVAAAPRDEQNRAGIANLVRVIADDVRVGRLLFNAQLTNPVLARKRAELGGVFALLSGDHVTTAYRLPRREWVTAVAHFVVGGVGQTISAWVSGDIAMTQAELVDQLTGIVDTLAARSLDRT